MLLFIEFLWWSSQNTSTELKKPVWRSSIFKNTIYKFIIGSCVYRFLENKSRMYGRKMLVSCVYPFLEKKSPMYCRKMLKKPYNLCRNLRHRSIVRTEISIGPWSWGEHQPIMRFLVWRTDGKKGVTLLSQKSNLHQFWELPWYRRFDRGLFNWIGG